MQVRTRTAFRYSPDRFLQADVVPALAAPRPRSRTGLINFGLGWPIREKPGHEAGLRLG